ncbi:acyltransferase family protein [Phaeobacter inhibens]|uniref:acyltransferase family protein n=1 Tax=Phaeobacter inhibens TaxID=221822 RepID=UPI0021A5AC1B|nr:acyltransferase [Phaeobacter inhibens]
MNNTITGRRLAEVDGLRAVAVLAVVLYHYFQAYPQYSPYGAALLPLAKYGDLGVELFFVISGFVITLSLSERPGPLRFALKRLARLWPALVVCSLITFVFVHSVGSDFTQDIRGDLSGFAASWTFTSQRFWHSVFGFDGYVDVVYWTLAIEVRFYLLAAVICWLVPKGRFGRVAPLVLLIMQSIFAVVEFAVAGLVPQVVIETLFLAYAHLFAAGITFAAIYSGARGKRQGALVFWAFSVAFYRAEDNWEVTFLVLIFLAVAACALRLRVAQVLAWRPLAGLGLISYPVYLLHNYIGVTLLTLLPAGLSAEIYVLAAAVVLGGIIILSMAIFRLVEVPSQTVVRTLMARSGARGHNGRSVAGG